MTKFSKIKSTIRGIAFPVTLWSELSSYAKMDNRNTSNLIRLILERWVAEQKAKKSSSI